MTDETSLAFGNRIAVTGVGLVTPLGTSREETWQGILSGKRCVDWLNFDSPDNRFESSSFRPFGARVPWDDPVSDRLITFATTAAAEAVHQAGLTRDQLRSASCVVGTSKIDLLQFDHLARSSQADSADSSFIESLFPSSAATRVAESLGCEAAVLCPVAACATGLVSLIRGANLIRSGQSQVAIAGSADVSLHPGLLASYRRLGVLANPGNDPGSACRPFSRDRSGFAVGEGAGILVLEEWEQARNRQAPILAEWVDGTLGSDPSGLTLIDPAGTALANVIQKLLNRCGVSPVEIDCVSLHGTATLLNDTAEAAALHKVFAEFTSQLPAFGLKGALGHLMGAAGAVESATCVLGLSKQQIPPTVNHTDADPEFLLNLLSHSRSSSIKYTLKLSLGFGGTVAAALFRRVESAS